MQREAQSLGLVGWVKNLPDGSVEAVVQGTNEQIGRITQWCAVGPPAARVADVETHDEPVSELAGFDIRY